MLRSVLTNSGVLVKKATRVGSRCLLVARVNTASLLALPVSSGVPGTGTYTSLHTSLSHTLLYTLVFPPSTVSTCLFVISPSQLVSLNLCPLLLPRSLLHPPPNFPPPPATFSYVLSAWIPHVGSSLQSGFFGRCDAHGRDSSPHAGDCKRTPPPPPSR